MVAKWPPRATSCQGNLPRAAGAMLPGELRAMCPALVLGGSQPAPQKPLQWAAHPRVGCRGLLVAPPLQTPFHGRLRSVRWGECVHQHLCWKGRENPLNPSPASYFFPFASPCEVVGAAAPAWGFPLAPPPLGSLHGTLIPLLCRNA